MKKQPKGCERHSRRDLWEEVFSNAAEEVKEKVSRMVTKCPLVMARLVTCVDLNVLPP